VFSLSFIENADGERFGFDPENEMLGKIRLGDFEEYFVADTTFWSADDYRAQWREGLSRLCDGVTRSCLLASVSNPEMANYFQSWPIYRFGSEAIFQNRLLMFDQLGEPFLFSRLYDLVLPYSSTTEGGVSISEWKIPLRAVQEFLATGHPSHKRHNG